MVDEDRTIQRNDFITMVDHQFSIPPLSIGYKTISEEITEPSLEGTNITDPTSVLQSKTIRYNPLLPPITLNDIVQIDEKTFLWIRDINQNYCNLDDNGWKECEKIHDAHLFMNKIVSPHTNKQKVNIKWQSRISGIRLFKYLNTNKFGFSVVLFIYLCICLP